MRRLKSDRPVRLAVFNHKGGVGKTTLTVNIAAALADSGSRVLLVDSDPQCNLSSYLIEDSVVDALLNESDGPNGATIWSALKPVVEARGDIKTITPVEFPIKGILLLPGDVRLSEFEAELNEYWGACLQRKVRGFTGMAALSRLIDLTVARRRIDFVFYDTGPNIGPLNKAILLDCDYFIIPGACDLFSVRALKTLGYTLRNWITDWQTIEKIAPDGLKMLTGKPKYLGYIPQRFRVYRQIVAKKQMEYLALFEKRLRYDILEPLKRINPSLVIGTLSRTKLGQVKDFSTLVQCAQEEGVPLWKVTKGSRSMAAEAGDVFRQIAASVLELTREKTLGP